ncbi:hypothetical protein FRB95_010036 [Tulasnella sp. JGI-2019a]|nr:hypothetical protein FRB95_010036 [Tulasnella sp. JGI-2019a]
MSSTPVFSLRWGILGAGKISSSFVKDVLLDPATRDVDDVCHKVSAIGSRDLNKAQKFIDGFVTGVARSDVKAYGNYEQVVTAEDVDAIYIGTPHTHHYDCTVLAFNAGKHVLLEKPATVNAAELRSLINIAKEKNVFFMEAMWTRFLPVTQAIKEVITSGELGELKILHADLSGDFDIENISASHRILDPLLGGGALLDLGPYPLVWAILALYEDPRNGKAAPSAVSGSMVKTKLTGVDSSTAFVLDFQHLDAQAILSCSITIPQPAEGVVMRFRKGTITTTGPIFRPTGFVVEVTKKPGSDQIITERRRNFTESFAGGGWYFQADEVARCIRDGKTESEIWGLDKTLLQMEIFDQVRKQGKYTLPPGVEKVTD